MRNLCDSVVEVLRSRSAEVPLNLEEILSHVIVLGALDRKRPHDVGEIAAALASEMTRRGETHLPQRFTTTDGVWWALVDPPPTPLRPAGRGWMAQLLRDVRWRGTASVGTRLESFRYDASSATALLRAGRQHGERDATLAGQIAGTLTIPRLRGGLTIAADVDGDVVIDGPIAGDVTIDGQVSGSVRVNGPIDGTLRIASSVHRGVRVVATHVGRVQIDGQIGGSVHLETRVIEGITITGWVGDDVTIAGNVGGGARVTADISGRLVISKRVIGNVKVGGWILGGIEVTGAIDGELAIQSWVGGEVSITAPVTSVDLGIGRFHGPVKLRPGSHESGSHGTARTTLTSIRLAEFHAPVRIHCDVDTTAVDTTGAVGRSHLRCIGTLKRPYDQDVAPAIAAPSPVERPRLAESVRAPSNQPMPVFPPAAIDAEILPSVSRIEPLPQPTPTADTSAKLPVAETPLTLAELVQTVPDEELQPLPTHHSLNAAPSRSPLADIPALDEVADVDLPNVGDSASVDDPGDFDDLPDFDDFADIDLDGIGDLDLVDENDRVDEVVGPQPITPAVEQLPTPPSLSPTKHPPTPAPSTLVELAQAPATTPIPTTAQRAPLPAPPKQAPAATRQPAPLEAPPTEPVKRLTLQLPVQARPAEPTTEVRGTIQQPALTPLAAPDDDLGATRPLVLGVAWLS